MFPTGRSFAHLHRRLAAAARAGALPAAIGAVALALRLHGLGDKPFWLDEITSLRRATASIPDLVLDSLHNRHYPTYFLLLWLVARIGVSQWLLRLPSAIFGAVAAAIATAIGRKVAGPGAGAVAGLLLALSPMELQLAQEARSYTLVCCLILIALSGLLHLARDPAAAALPGRMRGAWLAYGLGTAAALGVLGVAVPWLVAANLGALAIARVAGPARRAFLRRWAIVQGLVFATWAPWLAALLLANQGSLAAGASWAPPETLAAVWATLAPVYLLRLSNFITFDLAPAAVPGLSLVVAGLAAAGCWRLRREPAVLAVLAAAALLLPLGVLLLSPLVPVLVPRYLAWGAAPFFILAAAGLGGFATVRSAAAAAALGAACLLNLAPYYRYETKPRWDLAATRLAAEAQPGDIVLADRGYTYNVLSIYTDRAGLAEHGIQVVHDLAQAQQLAPGHRVWALYGRTAQQDIESAAEYLHSLAGFGAPVAAEAIGRYITIYAFDVPAAPEPPPAAAGLATISASPP